MPDIYRRGRTAGRRTSTSTARSSAPTAKRKSATDAYVTSRARTSQAAGTTEVHGGDAWAQYDKLMELAYKDGKLSNKEKRALNRLAKEARKAEEAYAQASTDAIAYAEGIPPAEHESRGLELAQSITGAVASVGGAVATAYGQPQLGSALAAAGQALGVQIPASQVATAEGQQLAAVQVGQAAAVADYDHWYADAEGNPTGAGIGALIAGALALLGIGYAATRGNGNQGGGMSGMYGPPPPYMGGPRQPYQL